MTPENIEQAAWAKQTGEVMAESVFKLAEEQQFRAGAIFIAYERALLITLSMLFKENMSKAHTVMDLIHANVTQDLLKVEQYRKTHP